MGSWTLAKKELRLLLRDFRALVLLVAMPLIFILVLGISVGEGFGQKPDSRLRVSVLNLDDGPPPGFGRVAGAEMVAAWVGLAYPGPLPAGPDPRLAGPILTADDCRQRATLYPFNDWASVVLKDLGETAGIRVELLDSREQADRLVRRGERAAVLVLGPSFSKNVSRSSFLGDGINPFFRDGVKLDQLDVIVLNDPTQPMAESIITQAAQGTLLRVVLPWMIGRAFEKLGEEDFIAKLGKTMDVPVFGTQVKLEKVLKTHADRRLVGLGVQAAIREQFSKYDLTAKTWAALTRADTDASHGAEVVRFEPEGTGILKLGSQRYKLLVPAYTVMFSFFMVLTIGWLFVAERRQGTWRRLCAAPITRLEILLGKLAPCYLVSVAQGLFLLAAGRLIFGMSWGSEPLWLVPVVLATSLAAMGMGFLVAVTARTEAQVAIFGSLLVLVLAGLSGCLMGNRSLMPEAIQRLSRVTPHAWSLDAYLQLLVNPRPDIAIVASACGVLTAFGIGFLLAAWRFIRLD
jgi:ABC-2 type transport system permease protein